MKAKVEITFDSPSKDYAVFKDAVDSFLKALESQKINVGDDLEIKIHTGEEKTLLMENGD